MDNKDLNVALEENAFKRLVAVRSLLPSELVTQLDATIPSTDTTTPIPLPHSLLLSVSRWARTDAGRDALLSHQPPQDPRDFDMIALLAGSTTSPEKHFPAPVGGWAEDERARKREMDDRRVITNVINAVLSIGSCGVAAWYAAGATGWDNEWRVLLGLLSAIIVAVAEGVLYLIWTNNASTSTSRRPTKLRKRPPTRQLSPPPTEEITLNKISTTSLQIHQQDTHHRHNAMTSEEGMPNGSVRD